MPCVLYLRLLNTVFLAATLTMTHLSLTQCPEGSPNKFKITFWRKILSFFIRLASNYGHQYSMSECEDINITVKCAKLT